MDVELFKSSGATSCILSYRRKTNIAMSVLSNITQPWFSPSTCNHTHAGLSAYIWSICRTWSAWNDSDESRCLLLCHYTVLFSNADGLQRSAASRGSGVNLPEHLPVIWLLIPVSGASSPPSLHYSHYEL